ncbi:MAG: uroporphyrinogen decarboxylase family protein [Promethearchaeota archaeon]
MNFVDYMPLYINCGISFSSDWYFHNVGLSMDEEHMKDTRKRLDYKIKARRHVENRYPEIFMPGGTPMKESSITPELGWGVVTLAHALGAKVRFDPKMDPTAIPSVDITKINIVDGIRLPNMEDALQPVFEEIDEYVEMGFQKKRIGMPNLQGPLNIAFETFGDNQVLSLLSRKKKAADAKHILEITSDAFIQSHKILRRELGRSKKSQWTAAGCTYVYLAPRTFRDFVKPVLEKCVDELGPVALHHCGTANDDQIDAYSEITWNAYEFGFGTDLARAREKIVNEKLGPLQMSCRVSPYRMLNQSHAQIKKDVEWIIEKGKGGPQSISVVGCPNGTPNENIYAMWNAIQDHNRRKAEEDEDEDW